MCTATEAGVTPRKLDGFFPGNFFKREGGNVGCLIGCPKGCSPKYRKQSKQKNIFYSFFYLLGEWLGGGNCTSEVERALETLLHCLF